MSKWHAYKLSGRRWRRVRLAVLRRDRYQCQACGIQGAFKLEVDHIVPLSKDSDAYAIDGLQTLCPPCHRIKTMAERGTAPPTPHQLAERAAWKL